MTSRGFASLQVAEGLPEVLACPWVASHASAVDPGEYAGRELDGSAEAVAAFLLSCADKGYDRGVIDLEGVNWFDDAALIAAAPQAAWQVYLGVETEQPGLWLACTPGTGLVEASHVDHDVMVPVSWADPGTRTGDEERHLDRITAARAALEGMPQGRWHAGQPRPGATPTTVPASRAPAAGSGLDPLELVGPRGQALRVTQPVIPGTPTTPMRPPTPGRSVR